MADGSLHFWNRSTGKDSQMRGYDGKLELVGFSDNSRYLAPYKEFRDAPFRNLFNPVDPITEPQIRDTKRSAPLLGIDVSMFPVKTSSDLPATFRQMLAWRADAAVWLSGQSLAFQLATIELTIVAISNSAGTAPGSSSRSSRRTLSCSSRDRLVSSSCSSL